MDALFHKTNIEKWIVWYYCNQALNPSLGGVQWDMNVSWCLTSPGDLFVDVESNLTKSWYLINPFTCLSLLSTPKNVICIDICSKLLLDILKLYESVNSELVFFFMNSFFQKMIQLHFKWIHFRFDWVKWYNTCPGYYTTVKEIGWQLAWWILFSDLHKSICPVVHSTMIVLKYVWKHLKDPCVCTVKLPSSFCWGAVLTVIPIFL